MTLDSVPFDTDVTLEYVGITENLGGSELIKSGTKSSGSSPNRSGDSGNGQNDAPTISITAPTQTSFDDGTNITFTASVSDDRDTSSQITVTWSSDKDGTIGTGQTVSTSSLSLGSHTITATGTDTGNLSNSDTLDIQIVDNIAPNPPVITTSTTLTNTASFTVSGTAEADSTVELFIGTTTQGTVTATSGTWSKTVTLSEGSNSITATATDGSNNESGSSTALTVTLDTTDPTFEVKGNSADFETTLEFGATYDEGTITNISESNTQQSITNNVDDATLGTYSVVYTVTDQAGNSDSITETVIIQDTIAPSITAPSDITTEATNTLTPVEVGTPIVDDEDSNIVLTKNNTNTSFPLGITIINHTATDGSNNSNSATQTITITDNTKPVITKPSNITVEATDIQTPVTLTSPQVDELFLDSLTSDAPLAYDLWRYYSYMERKRH